MKQLGQCIISVIKGIGAVILFLFLMYVMQLLHPVLFYCGL
jgi:hypothetical protein